MNWKTKLGNFRDYTLYLLLRLVLCGIQMMSLERCDRIAHLLAKVFTDWIPIRKKLVESNMRLIYPDWSQGRIYQTRYRMWHHLFLMVFEIALSKRKIHRSNWHEHYIIPNRGKFVEFAVDHRPKIAVTGHFGNFELAGYITGLLGFPTTTIARPLDNPYVHEYITWYRSLGGQHFIPKDDSAGLVQKVLDGGGMLSLLADQDAGNKGCWVKFLGQPASCHKALALFTLSSGAPMLVMSNRRLGPLRFHIDLLGIADPLEGEGQVENINALTQWYNDQLAKVIHANPEQYWWLHRRWRDPPSRLKKFHNQAAA
ncbi:MAG: lysophospholipid acyltransferase family protein [Pirellulales bacterium]